MPFIGTNLNCVNGNKNLPDGYIFNESVSNNDAIDYIGNIIDQANPATVRSIIWPAERDNVSTPWLHIPLTHEEINRIVTVVDSALRVNNTTHYELSWGPLWEALPESIPDAAYNYLKGPDNPYNNIDELAGDMISSFTRLCDLLSYLPTSRIQFDLFNELDARTQPHNMLLMEKVYPDLVSIFVKNKISYTVSTIVEPDGSTKRSRLTYIGLDAIQKKNKLSSLPFVSLHMNGFTDQMLNKHVKTVVQQTRKFWNCPVGIGECDVDTSFATELNVMLSRPMYFCNWSK